MARPASTARARGVVVSHPLRMRRALGSIPSASIICTQHSSAPRSCTLFASGTATVTQDAMLPDGLDPPTLRLLAVRSNQLS